MAKVFYGTVKPWTNQDLVLYHGTTKRAEAQILAQIDDVQNKRGTFDLNKCSAFTDFGRAFYTTTDKSQAFKWAWSLGQRQGVNSAVLAFDVNLNSVADLDTLSFAKATDDFWSLVTHCRSTGGSHCRNPPPAMPQWYDLVVGPVVALWKTQFLLQGPDQFSFHTDKGISVLQNGRVVP